MMESSAAHHVPDRTMPAIGKLATAMTTLGPYQAAWANYRRRTRTFWIIFATFIPGVFAIGVPLESLFHSSTPFLIVALLWMLAFAVSGLSLATWPCPRCSKQFFRTLWFNNPLATRCVHCKLPKWASGPTD